MIETVSFDFALTPADDLFCLFLNRKKIISHCSYLSYLSKCNIVAVFLYFQSRSPSLRQDGSLPAARKVLKIFSKFIRILSQIENSTFSLCSFVTIKYLIKKQTDPFDASSPVF